MHVLSFPIFVNHAFKKAKIRSTNQKMADQMFPTFIIYQSNFFLHEKNFYPPPPTSMIIFGGPPFYC